MNYRIDGEKLSFQPMRVAQWLADKDQWDSAKNIFPIYVELSPVGACNHQCTFCSVDYVLKYNAGLDKIPQLDAAMLEDRFYEMGALGVKSVMFAGDGEPLLHKDINRLVRSAKGAGLDVAFTTNGVLLDKLDLDDVSWVKVSLNAGTRETYAAVHRTKPQDFDRVVKNLEGAVKRKGSCTVGAQMVLIPENAHEVSTLQAIGERIGLDYVVAKPYQQHSFSVKPQYEKFIPIIPEQTGKLVVREASMKTKEAPYSKCQATPYMWAYVSSTGDVYSCSAFLLDDKFNLGNINRQTFKEIWHGEKRKANWHHVRDTLDIKECKVNCRMSKANIYLTQVLEGVPHGTFI